MKPALKQVAALPLVETTEGPLVLLVTTRGRGHWTIPKGWPKPGMADAELAAREALEEAGVEGDIAPEPLGSFGYTKRLHLFSWARCNVDVYRLAVRCQRLGWPERASRRAVWVAPAKGATMVRERELAAVLAGL